MAVTEEPAGSNLESASLGLLAGLAGAGLFSSVQQAWSLQLSELRKVVIES